MRHSAIKHGCWQRQWCKTQTYVRCSQGGSKYAWKAKGPMLYSMCVVCRLASLSLKKKLSVLSTFLFMSSLTCTTMKKALSSEGRVMWWRHRIGRGDEVVVSLVTGPKVIENAFLKEFSFFLFWKKGSGSGDWLFAGPSREIWGKEDILSLSRGKPQPIILSQGHNGEPCIFQTIKTPSLIRL